MNKNVIIIGFGEVGQALAEVEGQGGNRVFYEDKNGLQEYSMGYPKKKVKYDVMHICLPNIPNFVDIVVEYSKKYKPKLIINNSTTPVGITRQIQNKIWISIAHSPIRGIHPRLAQGIRTFVKCVGGEEDAADAACDHFAKIGLNVANVGSLESSELLKLLDTTYYGWNIMFAKLAKDICDRYKVDYESVYTFGNITYNNGYKELGMPHVVRPVLFPPKNGVGGHCIMENVVILDEQGDKEFSELLYLNKDSKKKHEDRAWLYINYTILRRRLDDMANECDVAPKRILENLEKLGLTR